ncbi:MAG: DEAD/DEAH box helicase [Bacillota bacterium]
MTGNDSQDLLAVQELQEYWQQQGFNLLPHQYQTVEKVINQLGGRALLADEVGLGKTIEAGMILKEYLTRGIVETCLILTPASLGLQWWRELNDKFKINLYNNRRGKGWSYFNIIISSLDKAKREPHCSEICNRGFDLVIVDEAHRLKNEETLNWKFVNQIPKKYLLLLTATPLQNDLKELYNLIKLLRPDLYSSYHYFKEKHGQGKKAVKNLSQLQKQLSQIMIRNKRSDSKLTANKQRKLKLIVVKLEKKERKLYNLITNLIKEEKQIGSNSFQLLTLQREICSSSFAVVKSLERMLNKEKYQKLTIKLKELLSLAQKIVNNQKLKIVQEIMSQSKGQVIIFTEYKATQQYLGYYLYQKGYTPIFFSGDLSDNQKEWARVVFKRKGDVLISTEAGAQGINLQFSNIIINYDLPWNPMKLEQRIGRVDRLGQENNILVYNLITVDTIEENIFRTLLQKVDLFETVTGDQLELLLNKKECQAENKFDILNQVCQSVGAEKNDYIH